MTLGTILYILLFFVSVFISIMYLEFGAMALMGLMVTIPVCMFLFLLVLRKRVSVSVDSKNPLAEKDAIDKPARAAITLSVENKSHLLPVTKGIAKVRYENPFSGDKGKMKIRFSVDTGKKRDRRIPVVMDETSADSDRFSTYKKGDDPSEIFDIREYADGDKIQRIHWKLSSKTGDLMVKEGSLPLMKEIHIFIDLCATGTKQERNDKINRTR